MPTLEHKTLETKTATTTDLGEFSAIAAAYTVDRVNDRIVPGAFKATIARWQGSGKNLPLHWDHEGSPEKVIGYVTPSSMREVEAGLYVEGHIDIDKSELAKEAWRSIKNNAISLSFGYLPVKSQKAKDGVNDLLELDLFEVSAVPAPANPDTRFLSLKNVNVLTPNEARAQVDLPPVEEKVETEDPAPSDVAAEAWKLVTRNDGPKEPVDESLKRFDIRTGSEAEYILIETKSGAVVAEYDSIPPSAVEDGGDEEPGKAKSVPQDPLVKEAWGLVVKDAQPDTRFPLPEPEPEPEPLDMAEVQREAWALAMKTSG